MFNTLFTNMSEFLMDLNSHLECNVDAFGYTAIQHLHLSYEVIDNTLIQGIHQGPFHKEAIIPMTQCSHCMEYHTYSVFVCKHGVDEATYYGVEEYFEHYDSPDYNTTKEA